MALKQDRLKNAGMSSPASPATARVALVGDRSPHVRAHQRIPGLIDALCQREGLILGEVDAGQGRWGREQGQCDRVEHTPGGATHQKRYPKATLTWSRAVPARFAKFCTSTLMAMFGMGR